MAKRIVTKIGNIFCTKIDDKWKVYFQYICNDLTNLNSSVIRVFKTRYPIDHKVDLEEVVKDRVHFYAHTILRPGVAAVVWEKVGKSSNLGLDGLNKIWFATAVDHIFNQVTFEMRDVDPDKNWRLWQVNCEPKQVTKLPKEVIPYLESGAIYYYSMINDRIKFGYPAEPGLIYKYKKRVPLPDVDTYTFQDVDGCKFWRHFHGEYVVREIRGFGDYYIKLSTDEPALGNWRLDKREFGLTNWVFKEFFCGEELQKMWREPSPPDKVGML